MPGASRGKSAAGGRRRTAAAKKAANTPRRRARGRKSNLIAFLATADAARARAFYEITVGLRLVADDLFALVFDANGVMVRIQKVDVVTPAAYTTLGWKVTDITSTIRRLVAKGVQFERYAGLNQDNLGVWTSPSGARIAWFKDPEGHVLSLTQF